MPFNIALSGLDAASTDLEVTGHNIANAGTNGFKQSRAEFADLYASAISDVSTNAAGRGVRVARVAQQFSQGNVDFTASTLDLAVSGEGMFMLRDEAGTTSYTRAGAYAVDRDGYVVNHASQRLQVFAPIGTSTTNFNTGSTVDLEMPALSGAPSATANVAAGFNLSASESVPAVAFDPTVADSYNHSTSTTIYDSLGTSHTMSIYYRKTGANAWDAYTYVDGTAAANNVTVGGAAAAQLTFDSAGALITGAGDVDASGLVAMDAYDPGGGAANITMTYDYNDTTQFGTAFSVNNLSQDGFTAGRLSGVDIDTSGVVFARFTNGQSNALGKVALARFNNPQGLRQLGDTSWAETFAAGDVQMGEPGTSSFGLIQSGALESANVDIAEQLVNLITAQRNFQANAQVISTADTVTQTIINIR
ncbi:MAG: flagellar hook protein FlgE [Gammaproteobacteria bacterium]|nr:flagellar hook protein FlgE [Gammaproteobacteria bacterium]